MIVAGQLRRTVWVLCAVAALGANVSSLVYASASLDTPYGLAAAGWRLTLGARSCGVADEGSTLELGCAAPGAVITSVAFASYGMPTGACDDGNDSSALTADPACDADKDAVLAIVAAACVGARNCSFFASTDALGVDDPCFGTPKSLAVAVTCGDGGVAAALGASVASALESSGVASRAETNHTCRALFVRFGLRDRSRGCAWPTQFARVVAPLRAAGCAVDTFELVFAPAPGTTVDGIAYSPPRGTAHDDDPRGANNATTTFVAGGPCACCDACTVVSQAAVDADIATLCNRKVPKHTDGCAIARYKRDKTRQFALRQFWLERAVARLVREKDDALRRRSTSGGSGGGYDVAFAIGEDVALALPVTPGDVRALLASRDGGASSSTPQTVFVSNNYPWGGVTNAFYAARPEVLVRTMSIFDRLPELLPTRKNYEKIVNTSIAGCGVRVAYFENYRNKTDFTTRQPPAMFKLRHTGHVGVVGKDIGGERLIGEDHDFIRCARAARDGEHVRLQAILEAREAELAQLKGLDMTLEAQLVRMQAILEAREAELAQLKGLDMTPEAQLVRMQAILEVREAELAQLKGLDVALVASGGGGADRRRRLHETLAPENMRRWAHAPGDAPETLIFAVEGRRGGSTSRSHTHTHTQ